MSCTQQENPNTSFLNVANVREKLARVDADLQRAVTGALTLFPENPGRDLEVAGSKRNLPPKKGFSTIEGQARLLHDLASIELQALELGLRTLIEFQGFESTPRGFLEDLAAVTASEGVHLKLCLDALDEMGFPWGTWPVHTGLWEAVSREDSLLDRLLIVHRHLEGSGLDAGETLLRRLQGVDTKGPALPVVERIVREEVGHVDFGSRWYREVCRLEKRDPATDFQERFQGLMMRMPKRIEPIAHELRKRAGFTDEELAFLEKMRALVQKFPSKNLRPWLGSAISLPEDSRA